MVRLLRKRPRPDDLVTQQRKATNRRGRAIYLGLLAAFGLGIVHLLFGDLVFLRADGLVLRERTAIDAAYVARVEVVNARAGEEVAEGAPLFQLQSTEILERLADLSARLADLAARSADYRIRAETARQLLPIAERRERDTARTDAKLAALGDQQLLTSARLDESTRARYEARQNLVQVQTQGQVLGDEMAALNGARADAAAALSDLRIHYAKGEVIAPVGGTVGSPVPVPGRVFLPGQTMLTLYSGAPYVLAYLPRRYLLPLRPGMAVRIASGRLSAEGEIAEILPVTDELPKEFQNTFKPADRNQLARIAFKGTQPFPLLEKVSVSGRLGF